MFQFKKTVTQFIEEGGVFRFGTDMDIWGEHLPPRQLRDLGFSLGIVNVDNTNFSRDGVARRLLVNISGEDSIHLWTANQYRRHQNKEVLDINSILILSFSNSLSVLK